MKDFYLSILNSPDNATPSMVIKELKEGDIDAFVARFINGVAHQANAQTGHDMPIGRTTVNRMVGDLVSFVNVVAGINHKPDFQKIHERLRLNFSADSSTHAAREQDSRPRQ